MVTFLLFLLLAALAAAAVVVGRQVMREKRYRDAIGLLDADGRHTHEMCVAADREVLVARTQYDIGVAGATENLRRAVADWPHVQVGPVALYPDRVMVGDRRLVLSPTTRASVEATGSVDSYAKEKSSLGRMAVGGALLGKAGVVAGAAARKTEVTQNDHRELYLTIVSDSGTEVVRLDPDFGHQARNLAAQIPEMARAMPARAQAIRQAAEHLDMVRASDTELRASEEYRRSIGEDPLQRALPAGSKPVVLPSDSQSSRLASRIVDVHEQRTKVRPAIESSPAER